MALLIECKRSKSPYVFSQRVTSAPIPTFPSVPGCPSVVVVVGSMHSTMKPFFVMGLHQLPFVASPPAVCASFSKAQRGSNKKIDLSGSDPSNTLILPLVKAHDGARHIYDPNGYSRAEPFHPTLLLSVSVLDAPMVLVTHPTQVSCPLLTPWVRVVRQEVITERGTGDKFRYYVIDAVHIDSFDSYIQDHLLPFAEVFAERAIRQAAIIRTGGIADTEDWEWDQLRPR
jgi:hypothetical protein